MPAGGAKGRSPPEEVPAPVAKRGTSGGGDGVGGGGAAAVEGIKGGMAGHCVPEAERLRQQAEGMMRRAEVLEAAATTTDAAEQPRRVVVTDHAADHFEAAKTAPDSMPVKSMTRTIVEGENEMERHMRTIMQTIQEGAEQTATDMRDLAVAEREHTIQLVAGEVARQLGHGAGGTDARMSTAPLEERHGEASSTRGSRCWCRCRRRRWEGGGARRRTHDSHWCCW